MAVKINRGGDWIPPRILIYGDEKAGKTSTAAQAPKPLFIGDDDGCRGLGVDFVDPPSSWNEFVSQLSDLTVQAPKAGYESIVLDTANGVVDLCATHVCETQFSGRWNDPKHGFLAWGGRQGWGAVSEEIRSILPLFDKLRDSGLWVVVLAHSDTERVSSPTDGEYDRHSPAMNKWVFPRFTRWADVILRIDYQKSFTEDNGKRRVISDGTRLLRCAATLAEVAGCRAGYELPDVMPLSWSSIDEHLGASGGATIDRVRALLDKMDGTTQAKALEWLGVEALEDAPTHKLKELAGRLQAKLAKSE